MEETIETKVAPEIVWKFWEKRMGVKEKGPFRYKIFDVKEGRSFSILWKSLFVRMIFNHSVKPISKGSLISYQVEIKGFFAWPLRYLLKPKLERNIRHVLKAIASELENQAVKEPNCGGCP